MPDHHTSKAGEAPDASLMANTTERETPAHRHHVTTRALFVLAGVLCLALAVAGVVLPLLPTTPFVLLAAACFARGSRRFHRWITGHRTFGPIILEWQQHRSMPLRVKRYAISLMAASMSLSILVLHGRPALQGMLVVLGLVLGAWMWRIPSRPG